jgi:AcrR family transcriptional regulator
MLARQSRRRRRLTATTKASQPMNPTGPTIDSAEKWSTVTGASIVEQGYESTSMKDIAAQAGVSVQTIYDSVGGKAALVTAINDMLSAEVGSLAIAGPAIADGSVDELLAVPARIALAYVQTAGDVLRVAAGTGEPAVQELVTAGRRRHTAGARKVAEALDARNALRSGVDARRAAEIIAAVSDPQYLMILREGYRWSIERIRTFVTDTLRAALVG